MQVIKIRYIGAAVLLLACTCALADIAYEQGKATLPYTGRKVPAGVRAQAIQNAALNAIETYYAKAGGSATENFESIRARVAAGLNDFVLDETVIEELDRRDVHEYSVSLRARLNVSKLENALKSASGVAAVPRSARSRMTFLVVARQTSIRTDFDARTFQRTDVHARGSVTSSTAEKTSEGETVAASQVDTRGSRTRASGSDVTSSVSVERGGSTTRKAAESSWRIFPSSNMDQVLTGAFQQAGFRVSAAADVEPYSGGRLHVAVVQGDYKSGMDLQAKTLQDVEAGLRTANVPYLTLGTLDVGLADPDPATGLQRVSVTVNAKVMDLSDTIPDTVAAVGPVQYAGLGPTEPEAQTNALKLAAQNAATELISQLNNAGIH